ncbi:hypothetical protein KDI_54440 [Dictyobacter arantiisoli]|uniref:DNA damage-inducible protein D n=1 Tax=Dictyobacter arantiisoli TaxID=2014874 RepID=A0A5A5TJU5_9CHLR|nr:hypothetical protein KDI_54440 [Dictyobacter arantiisoli]
MEDEDYSNNTQLPRHTSPFDTIRQVDERGQEYWSARNLSYVEFSSSFHRSRPNGPQISF